MWLYSANSYRHLYKTEDLNTVCSGGQSCTLSLIQSQHKNIRFIYFDVELQSYLSTLYYIAVVQRSFLCFCTAQCL